MSLNPAARPFLPKPLTHPHNVEGSLANQVSSAIKDDDLGRTSSSFLSDHILSPLYETGKVAIVSDDT